MVIVVYFLSAGHTLGTSQIGCGAQTSFVFGKQGLFFFLVLGVLFIYFDRFSDGFG